MTINVISDIHCKINEHGRVVYPKYFNPCHLKPADFLVVAGDLGYTDTYNKIYEDLRSKVIDKFRNVFFIKGNHDYWDINFKTDKINYNDRYIEEALDPDTALLGCTLWSPVINHPLTVWRGINDYNYIPHYSIEKNNENYKTESKWLRERYEFHRKHGRKVIIVTHNNPVIGLIPERFKGDFINESFTVMDHSLDDIKPDLWICGHTHDYYQGTIDGVRYVRNPIGYSLELPDDHWYDTVVEV